MAGTDPVSKMIRNSNKQVRDTVKDYNECITEFDDFINTAIDDIGGPAEIKTKPLNEKILYVAEKNVGKGKEIEEKFVDKNKRLGELKDIAEKILSNQRDLIEENKSILEELQKDLNEDLEKKSSLEQLIEIDNDNIKVVDDKLKSREELISDVEAELYELKHIKEDIEKKEEDLTNLQSQLESYESGTIVVPESVIEDKKAEIAALSGSIKALKDNNPDIDATINTKGIELNQLKEEKRKFEDDRINFESDKTKKEGELSSLTTSLSTKETDFNNLKAKNEKLEENMKKNYETLNNDLKEIDIDKGIMEGKEHDGEGDPGGAPGSGAPGGSAPGGSAPGGGAPGSGTPGGGAPSTNTTAETSLSNLSDREVARKLFKNYIEATSMEEKKNLIKGSGYKLLVETGRHLRGLDRKRFYNSLSETRNQLGKPDMAEFKNKYNEMMGEDKGEEWYNLLFDNDGNPRNFRGMRNSLSKEELRKVKDAIDTISSKREELIEKNPELIEYFDDNFVSFVQINSLMEKTSRRGPFKSVTDILGVGKGSVCNSVADNVVDYNGKKVADDKKKQEYMNSLRGKLGEQTVEVNDLDKAAVDKLLKGNEHFRGNPQRDDGSR